MLVLTREIGQVIQIGDDITIHIVDIIRGRARIGIQAPRETLVLREELLKRAAANPEVKPA